MKTNAMNKAIVLDFWKRAIGQRDLSVAERLVSENYIQHSALGKPGKAGLMESLAILQQMPKPENQIKPLMQVIADGDYVAVHMLIEFGGQKMIVLDLVRLEEGLFFEHWDAVQSIPNGVKGYDDYILDATTEIKDEHLTEVNKKVVTDFYATIFGALDVDRINAFVTHGVLLHDPNFKNGIAGLKDWVRSYDLDEIHRVIGEGNFVIVQTKGSINHVPHAIYCICRLADGKIAEQWSVIQRIPEKMAHNNGMF